MKRAIYFSLMALCILFVAACSSDSPGKAAKNYASYMQTGEYEKFVDGFYFEGEASAEDIQQTKQMLLAMLQEKGAKEIEQKGGLKEIEVASEEVFEDKKTAKVVLKEVYGNGETDENAIDMIWVDGTWKMLLKK